ncbi:SDR family oxidoreductase [Prochlorococcus sp. MIT 1300]|uniref:SDR family oxidoreductase n=1 Tax=Prochlorococcus sp. MIT 1300 TaxID=3096218 RepID=UPI002A74F060|nr:SDR family oxidoreductase [Prochlorococcus sp. MIT 1300]
MKIAISGASGKTGSRIAEEALAKGYEVSLILRKGSVVPENLKKCTQHVLSLSDSQALKAALENCSALFIATGARPSIDLTGPARVDAWGVKRQVEACEQVGTKRVILVSSLCAGRWQHPLNLFGLILIWKRIGERALEESKLDWTVIRPGGLNEREEDIADENIRYTGADMQEDAYIPRRLVARSCMEALNTVSSIGQIVEVTSDKTYQRTTMKEAIKGFRTKAS